jgi:hypothetical protein
MQTSALAQASFEADQRLIADRNTQEVQRLTKEANDAREKAHKAAGDLADSPQKEQDAVAAARGIQ